MPGDPRTTEVPTDETPETGPEDAPAKPVESAPPPDRVNGRRAADAAARNAPPPLLPDPALRLRRHCDLCGGEVNVAADTTRCPLGHPLADIPESRRGWRRR